jgi:acetyltransferase-like isoleucine patch superfamily enzyme
MNKIKFIWWGIFYKKGIKIIGGIKIYKHPESFISIGENCKFLNTSFSNQIGINRNCMISTQSKGASIVIGRNCGFSGTVIGAFTSIKIEDNVKIGANVLITDSDWHPEDFRAGISTPVLIESNVWVGEGSKILKGVTIGKNTLIGAGSIVSSSIPENVIAAGVPCRVIRNI